MLFTRHPSCTASGHPFSQGYKGSNVIISLTEPHIRILSSQMMVLFGEVVEDVEGKASQAEVSHIGGASEGSGWPCF